MIAFPEHEYLTEIGKLAYAVSYLEWSVLGDLPHIKTLLGGKALLVKLAGRTTGQIANELTRAAAAVTDARTHEWLVAGAKHLAAVADLRNSVLHARPATINGKQRLYRWAPDRAPSAFAVTTEKLRDMTADVSRRCREFAALRLI